MALTTGAKNVMLEAIRTLGVKAQIWGDDEESIYGALHTQSVSFNAASGGIMTLAANVVFTIAADWDVQDVKIYDTAGTTQYATASLGAVDTYTYAGTYTLTGYTITLT